MEPDSALIEREEHPLWSELDPCPRLKSLLVGRWGALHLAAFVAIPSWIAVMFAMAADAHCMTITLEARGKAHELLFGYWAELSHGPFQAIGFPLLVGIAWWLVSAANSAFVDLQRLGCLRWDPSDTGTQGALYYLATCNRDLCRAVVIAGMIVVAAVIAYTEITGYSPGNFGWVQSGLADKWRPGTKLSDLGAEEVKPGIREHLASDTPGSLKPDEVSIGKAIAPQLTTNDERSWIRAFVTMALFSQWLLFVFTVWIFIKVLLVFWMILSSVSRHIDGRHGLIIELDCEAQDKRFGLGAFDQIYDLGMVMVLVPATFVVVNGMQNYSKGTTGGAAFASQFLVYLIQLLLFFVILVVPAYLLRTYTWEYAAKARMAVGQQLAKARDAVRTDAAAKADGPAKADGAAKADEAAKTALEKRYDLISQQTPWPAGDSVFSTLKWTTAVLLLMWAASWIVSYVSPAKWQENLSSLSNELPQRICRTTLERRQGQGMPGQHAQAPDGRSVEAGSRSGKTWSVPDFVARE